MTMNNKRMTYLGIDPGMSGGIVAIKDGDISVHKMPKTEEEISALLDLLNEGDVECMIEKVHSMPGQGVASSFKFGRGYGYLRGCLVSLGIPVHDVTPQKWMKWYGMKRDKLETKSQWKQRLKALASSLYPEITFTLKTCDAMLIAHYFKNNVL